MHTVKMMAKYISAQKYTIFTDRNSRIYDLLCRYHAYRATEEARQYCVEHIIINLYFLLPHILTTKKIPADNFDDALQNMVLSIIKAIDKYDIRRGSKFTAYLVGYFKDAVSSTFRDTQVVRNPVYSQHKNPIPLYTNEETSTLDAMSHHITLKNKSDALSPTSAEQTLVNKEVLNFLEYAISHEAAILTEKEVFVITYRYGIFGAPTRTLDQIADIFDSQAGWSCTKERIFQIQQTALKKLRKFLATNQVTA